MTSPNTDSARPAAPEEPRPGGIFREWILPIVVGLAIGAGLVWAWRHGGELLKSDAEKIVARWSTEDFEENDRLAEELRKLGKDARADLLQAFRRIEVPETPFLEDEWKFWTAQQLAGEPFFDTRSLLEIARDASAPKWDRRCAAAALVHTLRKDVDPTAVVPPLLEWLEDLKPFDHILALTSLRQLRSDSLFPPEEEPRLRTALLRLSEPAGRPKPADEEDEIRLRTDRERAVRSLGSFVSDKEVLARIWSVAGDEAESVFLRAAAVQTLVQNQIHGPSDLEAWKKLAASKDPIVRQTVAENLGSCPEPAYDQILAPLHADASPLVRRGSVESQVQRNRPTMLAVFGELVEDHDPWVRFETLIAAGAFKSHLDGMGSRQGAALRLLESSESDEDVAAAILALHMMTGQRFGFEEGDLDVPNRHVREAAIAAFRADAEGRKLAAGKWRTHLGGTAVWTDSDRRAALEKLLKHADPENVKRATGELAKLPK